MDDFDHTQITLNVDGQPVKVHFLFLENGDLTAAFIKGYQFKHVYQRDPARRRVPVNGMAARNPKDDPNRDYAMRLAMWRACHNLDGDYDYRNQNNGHDGYSLGPVGAKIYQAFREWQFDKNAPKLENLVHEYKSLILGTLKNLITALEETDEPETSHP